MKKVFISMIVTAAVFACNPPAQEKDKTDASTEPASPDVTVANQKGLELIGASDCTTCHAIDKKNIGPAYIDVAKKYEATEAVIDTLVSKIIDGGVGVWGQVPMTPHPTLSRDTAREMVKYILSLKNQ